MHFFYLDESFDQERFVVSALRVEASTWKHCFDRLKQFRLNLRERHGIKLRTEMHAHKFVRHCSDRISSRKLNLAHRRTIFEECLVFLATLPVELINVSLSIKSFGGQHEAHFEALNRVLNRIHTNVSRTDPKSHALLIFDKGKEEKITKLTRKLAVFNYVPSQYRDWGGGQKSKNFLLDRIIEDPVFRDSEDCYFLQLVDFAAYSLLKQDVAPTPFVQRWAYNTLFPKLRPILCLAASAREPDGVVRA